MRCSPWVGSPLRRGVTPVPDGSVGTEGEWFRELEGAAQVAPACGQAARERVLAQIQPCQVVELAQLRGQGGQLVVGQSQCPQVVELAQLGRQGGPPWLSRYSREVAPVTRICYMCSEEGVGSP